MTKKILLLGSGELGKEFVIAAQLDTGAMMQMGAAVESIR